MSREIAKRIAKLAGLAETLSRRQVVAEVLELPKPLEWAIPLPGGRCCYLIGGDPSLRAATVEALTANPALSEEDEEEIRGLREQGVIVHLHKPGTSRFIAEVNGGETTADAAEVACWGARGDRKTSAGLDAQLILADRHRLAGGALPFRTMVPTGSMVEHTLKLCRTLVALQWAGLWTLTNDSHLAIATVDGVVLLALDLFGTGDPDALDRLRMEAHGLWAEEVAPAAYDSGGGVSLDAWSMALTSMRLETPRKVAVVTSNYPDEDHWAWQRFETDRHPGTVSVRIPAGESASAVDRERWAVQLQGRPDLLARLIAGEPGSVIQGPQVAKGFNLAVHVAKDRIPIMQTLDFWLGWDSGASHCHALTIGQRNGPRRNIFAGLVMEDAGLKQFLEGMVLPWFQKYAPWALTGDGRWFVHRYDPSMNGFDGGDADMTPLRRIRQALGGGHFAEGATKWADREGPMLALLADGDGKGGPALQISPVPETLLLRQALTSRWYYATTKSGSVVKDSGPMKPNRPWEDLGDSFAYWCGGMAGILRKPKPKGWKPPPPRATRIVEEAWRGRWP